MKKTLFISLIIIFLLSCSREFDDIIYTITNDSSKTVSFTFNDALETLDKDESITFAINSQKSGFVPKDITFDGHSRSVNLTRLNKGTAGIFYVFSDNTPLTLNVENTLTMSVTIKADIFIDSNDDTSPDAFNGDDFTLTINEGAVEKASIYTSAPNFTVVSPPAPYKVNIEWELKDGAINVVIR